MELNVALLGGGMVSRAHLETLLEHPAIASVSLAESNPERLDQLRNRYPLRLAEKDYHTLITDPTIDLVDICLPHDLHYPVVMEAFASGKHVLLEKPISNTLAEADAMLAAADRSGKRFYVALNERFLPVHRRVKELLEQGAIGQPLLASLVIAGSELERMQQPDHWKGSLDRAGGGALADSGTHAIDLVLDWFGLPQAVQCTLGKFVVQPANKADDTACLTMIYADKIVNILVIYAAAGQPWSERRYIWGEAGSIHVQVEADDPLQVWQSGQLIPQRISDHNASEWWVSSVRRGIQVALDCLQSDLPFPVSPAEARRTLLVVRAAYCSARLQRQVSLEEAERTVYETIQ